MNARTGQLLSFALATSALLTLAAAAARADTPRPTEAAIAKAEQSAPYPTFGDVPPAPKDVRSIVAWKASVNSIRSDGDLALGQALTERWSLSGNDDWAARAAAEATPPAPETKAFDADTDALVKAMRERAMAPPRKR